MRVLCTYYCYLATCHSLFINLSSAFLFSPSLCLSALPVFFLPISLICRKIQGFQRKKVREREREIMFSIRSILRGVQLRPSSSSSVSVCHSSFYSSSSSSAAAIQAERTILQGPRNDWSRDEIRAVYDSPVLDLLFHGVSIYATLPLRVFFLTNLGKQKLKPNC